MITNLEEIIKDLQQAMGDNIEISADNVFTWVRTSPNNLIALLSKLKDEYGFNYLANLTSVDFPDRFEIIYHIYSIPDNRKIGVKTSVDKNKAEIPSAASIWLTADWQEREVYDLMGIRFSGHPNLIRILLPDDFEGHPLRKDFQW
ncbi:NADH-quinone oxidoreductase subunit C [Syntrophomonas erecta]